MPSYRSRPPCIGRLVTFLVAVWTAACSEEPAGNLITAPEGPEPIINTRADSLPQIGSDGSPITTTRIAAISIVLPVESGFTVEFVDSKCAAVGNRVTLTSPVFQVLLTSACQAAFPQTWPFDGPFPAGTAIVFLFRPGTRHPGAIRVSGDFPAWTLRFEDSTDDDFNDLVFTVTGADFCTMFDEEVDDPLLLDPAVQKILSDLADLSNFDEPFPNRLERGGYIVEQPDGSIEFLEHRYFTPDGMAGGEPELCVTPWDPGYQKEITDGGGTILGQIHTHPVHRGIRSNPGTCNRWLPRPDGTFDVQPISEPRLRFRTGPSRLDLRDWQRGAAEWPGYMMSPDRVYRWERKGPFGQTGLANRDDFELRKGAEACITQ